MGFAADCSKRALREQMVPIHLLASPYPLLAIRRSALLFHVKIRKPPKCVADGKERGQNLVSAPENGGAAS